MKNLEKLSASFYQTPKHQLKQSPIGKIPKEWEVVKLGEICEIKTGKSDVKDAVEEGPFLFFDRTAIIKRSIRFLFDCEAVIIPGEGKAFLPKYYSGKFDLHQRAYALLNFSKKVYAKFVFHWLEHNIAQSYLCQKAVGFTALSLRKPIISSLPIPLPPLPEQKEIARRLQAADNLIENRRKMRFHVERAKKKMMELLLTGKMRVKLSAS